MCRLGRRRAARSALPLLLFLVGALCSAVRGCRLGQEEEVGTGKCNPCQEGFGSDVPGVCRPCAVQVPAGEIVNDARFCRCPLDHRVNGTSCLRCETGHFSDGKKSECQPCGRHSFMDGLGRTSADDACRECDASSGQYQPDEGKTSCLECVESTTRDAQGKVVQRALVNAQGELSCVPCLLQDNVVVRRGFCVPANQGLGLLEITGIVSGVTVFLVLQTALFRACRGCSSKSTGEQVPMPWKRFTFFIFKATFDLATDIGFMSVVLDLEAHYENSDVASVVNYNVYKGGVIASVIVGGIAFVLPFLRMYYSLARERGVYALRDFERMEYRASFFATWLEDVPQLIFQVMYYKVISDNTARVSEASILATIATVGAILLTFRSLARARQAGKHTGEGTRDADISKAKDFGKRSTPIDVRCPYCEFRGPTIVDDLPHNTATNLCVACFTFGCCGKKKHLHACGHCGRFVGLGVKFHTICDMD